MNKSKRSRNKSRKGLPVYLDSTNRKVVASEDIPNDTRYWHPATSTTQRLWRCLEIVHDINDYLEDGANAKNSGKRKKKVKSIAGKVHSLIKAIIDLCKNIIGEPKIRDELGINHYKQVEEISRNLSLLVAPNTPLSNIRNKMDAHFDKALRPYTAHEILRSVPTHKLGEWLHLSLIALMTLNNLKIYRWYIPSDDPDEIRLMWTEPFLATVITSKEKSRRLRLDYVINPPAKMIYEIISHTVNSSQWMFKRDRGKIEYLHTDISKDWNLFKQMPVFHVRENT